jgi:hypothetical protein
MTLAPRPPRCDAPTTAMERGASNDVIGFMQ